MSILSRIHRWIVNHLYSKELTPKGECFKLYINDIIAGKDVYIQEYEDMIETLSKEFMMFGTDISREEMLTLLDVYFTENF